MRTASPTHPREWRKGRYCSQDEDTTNSMRITREGMVGLTSKLHPDSSHRAKRGKFSQALSSLVRARRLAVPSTIK